MGDSVSAITFPVHKTGAKFSFSISFLQRKAIAVVVLVRGGEGGGGRVLNRKERDHMSKPWTVTVLTLLIPTNTVAQSHDSSCCILHAGPSWAVSMIFLPAQELKLEFSSILR